MIHGAAPWVGLRFVTAQSDALSHPLLATYDAELELVAATGLFFALLMTFGRLPSKEGGPFCGAFWIVLWCFHLNSRRQRPDLAGTSAQSDDMFCDIGIEVVDSHYPNMIMIFIS